ncbi:hypothetical protein FV139_07850 [Parahaliea maris]|uniref:Uncharacterized protein n=1 Tax=Parahaliea maris TaxID=2716870 RepID=A0A5C9A6R6_9GAMM|nr:DUF6702 family protein [Parahaliea maris]TXS95769.1 hypothetical protein FV139_07850 [Parahaliea maris]
MIGDAFPPAASRQRAGRTALIWGLWLALVAVPAWPHPWHTSFAEIDWAADGATLEVALRVLPEDLETALTWRSGEAVVLVDTPEVRTLVLAYLAEHFFLRSESGQTLHPDELVGMDLAYDASWLYFTLPAPPEQRLYLHDSLLMDVDSSQTNRAQPLWAAPADTLLFTPAQPELLLWQGH